MEQEKSLLDYKTTTNLKGIAILLVVCAHVCGKYWIDGHVANLLGTGGVCLFLILSGYGLYCSYAEKGITSSYWKSKVKKVCAPYLIITLIWYCAGGRHNVRCFVEKYCID